MSSKSAKNKPAQSKTAQAEKARKRRNIIIASLVAVAVVAVGAVLLASGGSDSKKTDTTSAKVNGVQETNELLKGIPQQAAALGEKDAPITLVEFADLQCPFCRQFALTTYPVIVNDYVRKGKVRIEFRTMTFIGPDSEKAARAAAAAGAQQREAYFTQLWYFNQGQENSGYATDEFVEKIWKAAGVDVTKAKAFADSDKALVPVEAAQKAAEKYGVVSTPSFLIGETGKPLTKFDVNLDDAEAFSAAFDELLK